MDKIPEDEVFWDAEMILRSIQFCTGAHVPESKNFGSTPFFPLIYNLKRAVKHCELRKLVENCGGFKDPEFLLKAMLQLRLHPAFPQILGLDGTINVAPRANVSDIYISNRSWLYNFATMLCDFHKIYNKEIPKCAKHIAIFEADKLANKITTNICMNISHKEMENLIELIHPLAVAQVEQNKSAKLTNDAIWHLMRFKQISEKFFENLSEHAPFNFAPVVDKIDHTVRLEVYSQVNQKLLFLKSVNYFLCKEIDPDNLFNFENDMPIPYEQQDSTELITEETYRSMIEKRGLKLPEPIVIDCTPLETGFMLPFVSPNYKLCLPTKLAASRWFNMIIGSFKSLQVICGDRLAEVKSYIDNCLDAFDPYQTTLSTIDFDTYRQMITEWKAMEDNFSMDKYFLEYPSLCDNLFPQYAILCGPNDSVGLDLKWRLISFLAAFPKAALLMHNKEECRSSVEICCALDLILDESVEKPKRCDVLLETFALKAISKLRDSLKIKTDEQPNTSGISWLSDRFLNSPSSSVSSSDLLKLYGKVDKEQSNSAVPSGLKKGFLIKPRKPAIKNFSLTPYNNLEVPKPLPSVLNEQMIPYDLVNNCLRLLVFRKTFGESPRKVLDLSDGPDLIPLHRLEAEIRKVVKKGSDFYGTSFKQLVADIKSMIGSYSIPMIVEDLETSNFYTRVSCAHFLAPRHLLWPLTYSIICQNYKFERSFSKFLLEVIIQQAANSMGYWEIIDKRYIELEDQICGILKKFSVGTDAYIMADKKTDLELMQILKTKDNDIFLKIIDFLFGDAQFHNKLLISLQLKKMLESTRELKKFVHGIMKENSLLKKIVEQIKTLELFQPYADKDPIMTVFRVGGGKCTSLRSTADKTGCFVFCEEVGKAIKAEPPKKQDNEKIHFLYITYAEAQCTIDQFTGNKKSRTYLIDEPEVGYYTCPPIMSPNNIPCKPAYMVIRDLFNFLFYEMNAFRSIRDEHIPKIAVFVKGFCEKVFESINGKFCVSFHRIEFCFNAARELFKTIRDTTVQPMYVLSDEDLKKYDVDLNAKILKTLIKPGILRYYDETVDEMARTNFVGTPLYPHNSYTFVAFIREFEPLCRLTHSQDACATVGKCALRFIQGSEFDKADFCDSKADQLLEEVDDEDEGEEEVEESEHEIEAPKEHKYFGSYYLTALKSILFKKCYENLPIDITNTLEPVDRIEWREWDNETVSLTMKEFEELIMKHEEHFLPAFENMHCGSLRKMFSIIENVLFQSTTIWHMSKSITPFCNIPIDEIFDKNKKRCIPYFVPKAYYVFANHIKSFDDFKDFKIECHKPLVSFELDKMGYLAKASEHLYDDLTHIDILKECTAAFPKYLPNEIDMFWRKKKKRTETFSQTFDRLIDFIFEDYQYPFKESIVEELKNTIINAENRNTTLNNILKTYIFVKFVVSRMGEKVLVRPATSYTNLEKFSLPTPKLLIHHIKQSNATMTDLTTLQDAIVFMEDLELARMIIAKKYGSNSSKKPTRRVNKKSNTSTFSYITYREAVEMFEANGEVVPDVICTEEMFYGYKTCSPLMSPTNQLCKPAHVILRELFNFLNFEINIFRSIREEHFDDVRLFINQFISQFDLLRDERLCISCDEFDKFLEKGRQYFSTMMDENILPLQVPKIGHTITEVMSGLSILKTNVKPGLLRAYDLILTDVQIYLEQHENDTFSWFTLANEAIFRGFVMEYAGVAYLLHTQKQCNEEWGCCTLKFVNQTTLPECADKDIIGPFLGSDEDYILRNERSSMPKLPEKMKTSIFDKRPAKKDVPAPIDTPSCSTSQPSTSSSREPSVKPEVQPKSIPKTDSVLYNSNIITTCLKMILDDSCYQRVISRKNFMNKLPVEGKWIEWKEVIEVMKVVESVIPNFDTVMEVIKDLREIPGSAILFKSGKCLDFQIPNTSNIWNDIREISDIKQNWIRSLPIMERFYEKKSDDITRILVEYQLDKLAANIGAAEIVTIKCPKYFNNNWMLKMRTELGKERREKAQKFVEEAIEKIDTNKDMISQLKEIVMEHTDKGVADKVEKIMEEEYKNCKCKITYVIQFLFKLHRSMRIVEALCDSDTACITKRYDKETMMHIPKIRAERNGKVVFVEELKFGIDVAKRLSTDEMITDIDLPMDDNRGENNIETFNYTQREQLNTIGLPVEIVNMVDIKLKMDVITPISSPIHTLCIEAGKILLKLLDILIELRVFESLDSKNIDTLTIFIDDLMMYFKPEINATFCIDYAKATEMLDETRKKFKDMRPRHSSKKDLIEAATDKKMLTSFGAMLSSIMVEKKSKMEIDQLIDMADIRALLHEYPELGIAYHNQKLCNHDGKLAYCPLDYFDKNDKDLDYDVPEKCGCTSPEAIECFEKMHVTKLVKCDVPSSKNKLRLSDRRSTEDSTKSRLNAESQSLSTSTQTDILLVLDDTIEKKLDLLESDVRRLNLDKFDLKKKNTELENEKISIKRQLNALQASSEKKYNIVAKENVQWRKVVDDNQRMYERNMKEAEDKTKEQKKLADDWKMKYEQVVDSNQPSTSTAHDARSNQTVEHYWRMIEQGTNLLEAARQALSEFLNNTDVDSARRRAETELEDFEITMEMIMRKAQRNMATLENDKNTESDQLLKIQKFPIAFSSLTYKKMKEARDQQRQLENPECSICFEILGNEKKFVCKICYYECHHECFKKWEKINSTCPQCRRVVIDDEEFPSL